jgi:hypothetical protein
MARATCSAAPSPWTQEGQRLLAFLGEQPFGRQFSPAILEQFQQGALARQFQGIDHDLVFRAARIAGDPPDGDHLHAILRPEAETPGDATPAHAVQDRLVVLQGHIEMAGRGPFEAGNLAAHPDPVEAGLQGPFDRLGNLRNREFR